MHCLEIYPTNWWKRHHPPRGFEAHNDYFLRRGEEKELRRRQRWLTFFGWKTRLYDEKYARSTDYRRIFFTLNKPDEDGLYRCVYCGRRYPADKITVDHIVPVLAAKKGNTSGLGGRGVNDPSNLAPACFRCNERKGAGTGLVWRLRARLGKHVWFHIIRRVVVALILAAIIYGLYRLGFFSHLAAIIKSVFLR